METESLLSISNNLWDIKFYPFTPAVVISYVIVLVLLFTSALISGSEVAYFSLTPKQRQRLKESKTKVSFRTLKNLDNPEKLLATILVTNNFVNVGIIILTAFATSKVVDFSNSPALEFAVQVVLITFLLLLFGEIVPKVYANHYAVAFAKFMSLPLLILEKIFRPMNYLLIFSTSFVNRRLRKHRKNISMDEISQALELTSDNELSEEKEILEGIVKFGNKSVAEIMRSRVDVVALDIKTPFKEVMNMINDSGFSRIPVYSESFDQISGILYIKDLLPHTHKGGTFKWQSIIRPPFYVPETKKINVLLEEFRKRKVHLAIVVDEYGGSSGIVTLEDILEEIVGDINDEFDEEEDFFTKLSETEYSFDGKIMLVDFYKILNVDETIFDDVKGDADTLAGLILELTGEIPNADQKISCKNFIFSIEAVNNRRIEKIKVKIK